MRRLKAKMAAAGPVPGKGPLSLRGIPEPLPRGQDPGPDGLLCSPRGFGYLRGLTPRVARTSRMLRAYYSPVTSRAAATV